MKPTIYDIARLSGVSTATVSHVLNNTGRVRATTQEKVLHVIKELEYQRDTTASALAGKNSYSIGFLVPDVNNLYFAEILRGVEDEAFEFGYSILVCNTDNDQDKERTYLKMLRNKRMDGIIIATGSTPSAVIEDLVRDNIHVTVLSREIPDTSIATVTVDNFRGGYMAAQHLASLRHRHIAFITEPLTIGSSRDRLRGFETALHGEAPQTRLYLSNDSGFGIQAGTRIATELVAKHPVSAIFAANDQLAVGAIQACRQLDKRIPEDISIIGFDDTVLAKIVYPPLTTIAQPIYELGKRAASLTVTSIETGRQAVEGVILKPELVIRQSTGMFEPDRGDGQ